MPRFSAAARLLCAFGLGAFLAPAAGHAANFTVQNGQTVGAQFLSDSGDIGTIEQGGTIQTSGDNNPGVLSESDHQTVNNRGTITTDGFESYGIYSGQDYFTANNTGTIIGSGDTQAGINVQSGVSANLSNSGTITETGTSTVGISTDSEFATISNSGTITTDDDVTDTTDLTAGILVQGDNSTVTNTGTINTTGYDSYGILVVATGATAINRGTIYSTSDTTIGSGAFSIGVYAPVSDGAELVNDGKIVSTGDAAYGIDSYGSENSTIVNRGTIIANGTEYGEGVLHVLGDDATLINSGTIIATASAGDPFAIDMYGANNTITLLAHTALQGGIYIDEPSSATLNIGTGLNTALTFYNSADLPTTINTNGQPYVIDGSLLAVVDPTGLAAANSFGFDLSRTITDAVEAHLAAPGGDGMTTGALPGSAGSVHHDYWAAGLGFYGDHAAADSLDGYHYGAGGMMLGTDRSLSATTTAGLFGGVSAGRIVTAADSTTIDTAGGFAGGYWSHDDGKAFAHVSVTGGGLANTSDRTVANNLVAGGLETASADYGSFYISPALTLGLHHDIGAAIFSPSIGARYVGLYRGGYTESGSAADVTADAGSAQALDLRGEFRTDFAAAVSDAGVRRFNVRAGVDGIFTWGGAVDGELLGTDITLLANGQTSVARGYLGGGMTFTHADGTLISADVQASYDTADTFALSAQAGLNHAF
jgi:hypothetical protein